MVSEASRMRHFSCRSSALGPASSYSRRSRCWWCCCWRCCWWWSWQRNVSNHRRARYPALPKASQPTQASPNEANITFDVSKLEAWAFLADLHKANAHSFGSMIVWERHSSKRSERFDRARINKNAAPQSALESHLAFGQVWGGDRNNRKAGTHECYEWICLALCHDKYSKPIGTLNTHPINCLIVHSNSSVFLIFWILYWFGRSTSGFSISAFQISHSPTSVA